MEQTIYLAGGCFWGMEHLMSLVPGVLNAAAGYAQGSIQNPSYEAVCQGNTGHRETVKVTFDSSQVSLESLLKLYFSVVNPLTPNRQGGDTGPQYQAGIYWEDEATGQAIQDYAKKEKLRHRDFFIEIEPLTAFYPAEEEHQDYLIKNPAGYCHIPASAFERAKNVGKPQKTQEPAYRKLTPKEALELKQNDFSVVYLDVRTPEEYSAGHLPDAVNLPLQQLEQTKDQAIASKDDVLLIYCRSGVRSRSAAQYLTSLGYSYVYDFGGILSWPYDIER